MSNEMSDAEHVATVANPAPDAPEAPAEKPEEKSVPKQSERPVPQDYKTVLRQKRKELEDLEAKARASNPDRPDPDRYFKTAKQLVVDNYNENRIFRNSSNLTLEGVYIVWYAKALGNWKVVITSPVIRGILWELSYNSHRKEVYIDVYKKLNNIKVQLEE